MWEFNFLHFANFPHIPADNLRASATAPCEESAAGGKIHRIFTVQAQDLKNAETS